MAGKPELSTTPGVQNVVVYVSNDNFAQAYAVGQQNVPQSIHNGSYGNQSNTLAPVVGPSKAFTDKSQILKSTDYPNNGQIVNNGSVPQQQGGYFTNNAHAVISQNGFPQPIINNITNYQDLSVDNSAVLNQNNLVKNTVSYGSGNNNQESGPGRPDIKVRDDCDNRESYVVDSGYVTTVMGGEGPSQNVRCESVRSETAESSCSSSTDEGLVFVQQQTSDMVVYDGGVSVRPGGVVLTVGPSNNNTHIQNNTTLIGTNVSGQPSVCVPFGWKRLLTNGIIIYISPSNTALSSLEQVKDYLLTPGTCKCGLECPLKYDSVFNFDPKVVGKPWTLSPDSNTGDLTKLCNHKRKIIQMATLGYKSQDPNRLRKVADLNVKRKKRRLGSPYSGMPVSQVIASKDKIPFNQHQFSKDGTQVFQQQQAWPSAATLNISNQQTPNARINYQENPNIQQIMRYQSQEITTNRMESPVVVGETMMLHTPVSSSNISPPQQQQQQQTQQQTSQLHQQQQQQQQIQNTQGLHQNHNSIQHNNNSNVHIHHQQIFTPNNSQMVQGPMITNMQQNSQIHVGNNNNNGSILMQGQPLHGHNTQQRIFINGQPGTDSNSGPGRPNIQMIPISVASNHRMPLPFYNQQQQTYQGVVQQCDHNKTAIRPQFMQTNNNQCFNGYKQGICPPNIINPTVNQIMINQHQKLWPNRNVQQSPQNILPQNPVNNQQNVYERVPPLHQHTPTIWTDDLSRKKVKITKTIKKRPFNNIENQHRPVDSAPCPNIDVRQIPNENSRNTLCFPQQSTSSSPSFMEDPSGYLAQQTALLNSTISRQTGVCTNYNCNSPVAPQNQMPQSQQQQQTQQQQQQPISNTQTNGVPLPSNMIVSPIKHQSYNNNNNRLNQNINIIKSQTLTPNHSPTQPFNQIVMTHSVADSSAINEQVQCQGCVPDSMQQHQQSYYTKEINHNRDSAPNSQPGTPSSSVILDDPVTSSTYSDKHSNQSSPDSRPIQGGTISTSNVSPVDGSPGPSTPHASTPPIKIQEVPQINVHIPNQITYQQNVNNNQQRDSPITYQKSDTTYCINPHNFGSVSVSKLNYPINSGIVTTMASGRTVGSNTITSVLAGRANTATVSVNSPVGIPVSTSSSTINQNNPLISTGVIPTHSTSLNVSKSPLEMVQSVVSSIQVPHSQQPLSINHQHIVKQSAPQGLPPGHILVSSGGQIIMANTGNPQNSVMPPPPPKIVTNQGAMPPMSVSPMITNVTAAVTQVIPAVAQQVLGQQTVLVNALPTPFVLQPGVTMTMDGMTVGQNMQIPQLVTGNVIQQQIQIDGSDPRRVQGLLSPEKKKGKKRKVSSQTVASMLHIAAQQNSGVVMPQQGFPQQIQMAHSPQGITTGPVMQALTIVPGKAGGPPQIVMNGQQITNAGHIGTQQLIAGSQPTQQINLLQPVNLLNGTGMVQNFPTIQQFIVPNLGGMVMNADGTATILQDTTNLGMQLQLQNVNGQNVLTPVQNGNMFNGGQSILAAGPAGMVIRTPTSSQGKIIQQQHSPGAQFLSPNGSQFVVNGTQFSGQLSPLVANVSPTQQVTFGAASQAIRPSNSVPQPSQEYIQCGQMGQTLMVPCTPSGNISSSTSNQQNTTFVQQNTTIVQQQTTMVSNNQQIQNFQTANQSGNHQNMAARATTLNVDQNFILSSNDKQPVQALLLQQGPNSQTSTSYRHSVSTQTAVNQNSQAVTTNTFCQTATSSSAGSPPDTTTHSPMASGGQSPPTADTTTHTGSTDDGLSPAPSNCSGSCGEVITLQGRQQSCSMAMVHCVSSSEPDSADLTTQNSDNEWSTRNQMNSSTPKLDFTDISSLGQIEINKKNNPTHVAFAESSTMISGMHIITDHIKAQEAIVSSRNFEKILPKRKHSDALVVMETQHMHSSLFDDDEEIETGEIKNQRRFTTGDLVWGPAKGCPAWPGKLFEVRDDKVIVKWFGGDKTFTEVDPCNLQTLTEGLEAHHRARKKSRTSRKLNTQLENAIQEAMSELDKKEDDKKSTTKISSKESVAQIIVKKTTGRLRSSQT